MATTISQHLSVLKTSRDLFASWFLANVGNKNQMVSFLNQTPTSQTGVFLAFLSSVNLAIDIAIVPSNNYNGFSIRILDSAVFPDGEKQAAQSVYYVVDGDYYIARIQTEGKALQLYIKGIMYALTHINKNNTIQ